MVEQGVIQVFLVPAHFESVVEVNNLVKELTLILKRLHSDGVSQLQISMENAEILQFNDPLDEANQPVQQLSPATL